MSEGMMSSPKRANANSEEVLRPSPTGTRRQSLNNAGVASAHGRNVAAHMARDITKTDAVGWEVETNATAGVHAQPTSAQAARIPAKGSPAHSPECLFIEQVQSH